MSLLTKEDILKARVTGSKEFFSKTLGGSVRFKKMSALGHDAVDARVAKYKVDTIKGKNGKDEKVVTRKTDLTYYRVASIAYSQVDETGKLFWDGDADAVGQLSKDAVTELYDFVLEMNPPDDPDLEETKKALQKDPGGPSSSD